MNKQEYAANAVDLKANQRYSCSQAAACALADQTELSPETIKIAMSGLAGGVGTGEGQCGALSGAAMIAGLHLNGERVMPQTKEISKKFIEKTGAVTCKVIRGTETGNVLCSCVDCVKNAVEAYCEVMGIE